jgi:hypothetical protein
MSLFFFHIQDGQTYHDDAGQDLESIQEAKQVALDISRDVFGSLRGPHFWSGVPWKLWVTNQPNGGGITLLTLTFKGQMGSA